MKCPICETVMECLPGDRYQTSAFYDTVHYHCVNNQCLARTEGNYISHMSVLMRSWPYTFIDDGVCHEYHLPFKVDGKWFYLIGQQEAFSGTIMRSAEDPKPLMLVEYLPIPTTEDMDQEAWKLFWRLKNLLAFA